MTPTQFSEILNRHQNGICSQQEKEFIEEWYNQIGKGDVDYGVFSQDHVLEQKYLASLNKHIQGTTELPQKEVSFFSWYRMGIAASISLLVAAIVYLSLKSNTESFPLYASDTKNGMAVVSNSGSMAMDITLPEGSNITLTPGSKISYPEKFDEALREIYLEGEAFFNVTRDVNRPFLVYTDEVVTKVLGTSFNIKAPQAGKQIVVSVRTGKVSVYPRAKLSDPSLAKIETYLIPNQQVIFDREKHVLSRTLTETPLPVLPLEELKKTRFNDEPVTEIIRALEEMYGVEILIDRQKFLTCEVTTTITEGGIYDRLDIICKAIGATYSVEDTRIIVEGPGCN